MLSTSSYWNTLFSYGSRVLAKSVTLYNYGGLALAPNPLSQCYTRHSVSLLPTLATQMKSSELMTQLDEPGLGYSHFRALIVPCHCSIIHVYSVVVSGFVQNLRLFTQGMCWERPLQLLTCCDIWHSIRRPQCFPEVLFLLCQCSLIVSYQIVFITCLPLKQIIITVQNGSVHTF